MLNYEILEKLTRTIGVSGEEDDVRSVILSEIEPYADEIHISPLGNILAFKKGEKASREEADALRSHGRSGLCHHEHHGKRPFEVHDGRQYPPGGCSPAAMCWWAAKRRVSSAQSRCICSRATNLKSPYP